MNRNRVGRLVAPLIAAGVFLGGGAVYAEPGTWRRGAQRAGRWFWSRGGPWER